MTMVKTPPAGRGLLALNTKSWASPTKNVMKNNRFDGSKEFDLRSDRLKHSSTAIEISRTG